MKRERWLAAAMLAALAAPAHAAPGDGTGAESVPAEGIPPDGIPADGSAVDRAAPGDGSEASEDTDGTRPAGAPPPPPTRSGAIGGPAGPSDSPADLVLPVSADGWTAERVAERAAKVSTRVATAEVDRVRAETSAEWRAAEFAPRLDLRATYTRLSEIDQPAFSFGEITVDSPFPQILDQYALQASLTVPVTDAFLAVLPAWRAAKGQAEVARWQTAAERQSAALRAQEALYGLARVEAARLVAADAVRLLDAYIEDLQALFGAGQVTEADVLQARARRAEAVGQSARLESAWRVASQNLRIVLDLPGDAPIAIGEDVTRPPAALPADAELGDGWRDRPEVQALMALDSVYRDSADAAGASRWPSLSVRGNYTYANPNSRVLPQKEQFDASWDVSVILAWSPNGLVSGVARREDALLQADRNAADLETLREGLALQLAQAVGDYRAATAALAAADEQVEAAHAAWTLQRDLLRAGEATPNDVLDAESALRRAQAALFDVRIDCHLARARIDHAIGRAVPTTGG
ncbi:MAG: TolC family protein [Myxococcales bacterium]|nr:TolC family protein [Myxococcales bacterium]